MVEASTAQCTHLRQQLHPQRLAGRLGYFPSTRQWMPAADPASSVPQRSWTRPDVQKQTCSVSTTYFGLIGCFLKSRLASLYIQHDRCTGNRSREYFSSHNPRKKDECSTCFWILTAKAASSKGVTNTFHRHDPRHTHCLDVVLFSSHVIKSGLIKRCSNSLNALAHTNSPPQKGQSRKMKWTGSRLCCSQRPPSSCSRLPSLLPRPASH
jgi:hypothetical protein